MTTSTPPLSCILELNDVRVLYGDSCVLCVPSLNLASGEILLLTGPNGSGKSSLLLGLAGIGPKLTGQVRYLSRNLAALSPPSRPRHGLRLLPQGRRLFPRLTPDEHVRLAMQTLAPAEHGLTSRPLPRLRDGVTDRPSAGASGGEAKAILLASLLVPGLQLLMLDEPFAGLDARATAHLIEIIGTIRSTCVTAIIVDHTGMAESQVGDVKHATIVSMSGANTIRCRDQE